MRSLLPKFDDAAMNETWRMMAGDHEVMAVPRSGFVRDIMLSHWYQHRGQFCVYLRLLDVAVLEPLLRRLGRIGDGADLGDELLVRDHRAIDVGELGVDVDALGLERGRAQLRVGEQPAVTWNRL